MADASAAGESARCLDIWRVSAQTRSAGGVASSTSTAHPSAPSASPLDRHPAPIRSTDRRSGRAVASLVLGIIAVLTVLIPFAAWILGATAVALGSSARSDVRRFRCRGARQATAGMVLGVLALLGGTAVLLASLAMA